MKKKVSENHKLYYIEKYPAIVSEEIELYTGEDVHQVAKYNQLLHPESNYVIREFEHT